MKASDYKRVAEQIWRDVGYKPSFPRDLLTPAMETYDVAVIFVPKLCIAKVNSWLVTHRLEHTVRYGDRPLSGCLIARRGHALAFIDGTLEPNERRFAIAHELAHLVAHYLQPRQRAIGRFGEQILQVLDGERPPTMEERLSGLFQGIHIGSFEDFLSRNSRGQPSAGITHLESEADCIALELLAPQKDVLARTTPGRSRITTICERYGLPLWAAENWASAIDMGRPRQDPLIRSIESAIRRK